MACSCLCTLFSIPTVYVLFGKERCPHLLKRKPQTATHTSLPALCNAGGAGQHWATCAGPHAGQDNAGGLRLYE